MKPIKLKGNSMSTFLKTRHWGYFRQLLLAGTMLASIGRLIAIVATLAVVSSAIAVEVTMEQAQTAARNWVRRSPVQMTAEFKSSEVRHAQTAKADDGKALYHVVELDGGGFVVTSGDTELPPVIAFSASGTLDLSDSRNPLVALLERDLQSRRAQIAKPQAKMLAALQAQRIHCRRLGGRLQRRMGWIAGGAGASAQVERQHDASDLQFQHIRRPRCADSAVQVGPVNMEWL